MTVFTIPGLNCEKLRNDLSWKATINYAQVQFCRSKFCVNSEHPNVLDLQDGISVAN